MGIVVVLQVLNLVLLKIDDTFVANADVVVLAYVDAVAVVIAL